jgi:PPP family 3-phenylpropionic acid transporter
MVILAVIGTLGFAAYWVADGFWALLVVGIFAGVAHAGLMPLGENVALSLAPQRNLSYGRLRLWGSVAFIALSAFGGLAIEACGIGLTIWMLVGTAAWTALACALLPDVRTMPAPGRKAPVRALLRHRTFVLLLVTCGLLQASHAVFYALGTVHWRANGIDEATIGLLSAEAVLAEIVLFAAGGTLMARMGPIGLLIASGMAGIVRWCAMTVLGDVWSLAVLQSLHAVTFGAAHLAGMHILARAAPEGYAATAQSTYSAIGGGIAMGLALLASGPLYENLGAGAYGAMAVLSTLGLAGAWLLGARWNGERLKV